MRALLILVGLLYPLVAQEAPWPRHTIETGLLGADGAKLIDVNGDGRLDIVTGWEQSGIAGIYLHPDIMQVRSPWPKKHIGHNTSIEDAVCVDLDGDGRFELITSCEGKEQALSIFWPPTTGDVFAESAQWNRHVISSQDSKQQWMYAEGLQIDGQYGLDIVAGSKGKSASITWFAAPENPRENNKWTAYPLAKASWIMSIILVDMNGDNLVDILFSDRKGDLRGVRWLENPGTEKATMPWKEHHILQTKAELLFIDYADLEGDGDKDIVGAVKNGIILMERTDANGDMWKSIEIPLPDQVGGGKSIAIGDINGDGKQDLVLACESATPPKSGIVWLENTGAPFSDAWKRHEISGPAGIKYDHSRLIDLDGDGDLDVINSEENNNAAGGNGGLGLIWYENKGF